MCPRPVLGPIVGRGNHRSNHGTYTAASIVYETIKVDFSKTRFSMRYKKQANIRAHIPTVNSGDMILLVKSVYHQALTDWKALIHNRGIFGL